MTKAEQTRVTAWLVIVFVKLAEGVERDHQSAASKGLTVRQL